jgi:hypothetical protein
MNGNDDIVYTMVLDEAGLQCRYDNVPIYIPLLRTSITVGHFVVVCSGPGRSFIAQIIGRPSSSYDVVVVLLFLPLFSPEGQDYMGNIGLLPRLISSNACHDVTELFRTSSIATIRTGLIVGIAFIFLVNELENLMYPVQGMVNAFVIRFKFCGRSRGLIPLCDATFYSFPDMNVQYQQLWSECYARTIYSSLDHLRQEFWRFLCRYGQSQGLYPKQTLNFYFPSAFTSYVCNFLGQAGLVSEECVAKEPQRRVETYFIYRMVSKEVHYQLFRLESDEAIDKLTQMIGTMAMFGIRKKLPRKDAELVIRNLDLINAISKIELYVSASKIKVRLYAFRHVIGDASTCTRLLSQIGHPAPVNPNNTGAATRAQSILRLKSKFDFMGNVYEVVEELPNDRIRAVCKWGSLEGDEQEFDKDEVIALVNQKRGLT